MRIRNELLAALVVAWGACPLLAEPNGKGSEGSPAVRPVPLKSALPASSEIGPAAKDSEKDREKGLAITAAREAAVAAFVKQHHPELSELLARLKTDDRKEYERAVRELFRASETLAQIKERNPERFEIELRLWQAKSRVQLITARSIMEGSEELRRELRAALAEQFDLQTALLELERAVAAEKLDRLEKQLKKIREAREGMVEQQMRTLLRMAPAGEGEPREKGSPPFAAAEKALPVSKSKAGEKSSSP